MHPHQPCKKSVGDKSIATTQHITIMADYDSDSSGAEDVETNVLLGYASKEPTGDEFSQLGGHPVSLQPRRMNVDELG